MEPYKGNQIMVATLNVAGQNWMGAPRRSKVMANVFGKLQAQLMGFQEFGLHTKDVLEDVREEIKFLLGEPLGHVYLNTIGYDFNRFTPIDKGTMWLSDEQTCKPGWDGDIRAASWAVFADNDTDKQLLLVNIHPDNKGKEARINGIKQVLKFIDKEHSELPVILTADSNISIDSPTLVKGTKKRIWADKKMREPYDLLIKAGFVDCWPATHPTKKRPLTYHGFQGEDYDPDEWGTYDTEWILVRGFRPLNCSIVRDSEAGIYPSDHFWMTAQLTYE